MIKKMDLNRQRGYTIIELMVVITVLGVLAALAIAAYQDYVARSQMAEAMSLASGAKQSVIEFAHNTGHFPATNSSAGVASPGSIVGKFVSSVEIVYGVIKATMRSSNAVSGPVKGAELSLSPSTMAQDASFLWTCKANVSGKYLPTVCR